MKQYEKLTKYLQQLDIDNFGTWVVDQGSERDAKGPTQMPYVKYSEVAHNFVLEVNNLVNENKRGGLECYRTILAANGISWKPESMENADVTQLDASCIIALFVGAICAERLCDGALLRFFKKGSIHKWLKRLEEIDNEIV